MGSPDEVRKRLEEAAQQRQLHHVSGEALAERIRTAVHDAQTVGVPIAECARILEMDRSTLYRVYLNAA